MAKKQSRTHERALSIWLILAGFIFLFTPQSLTNKLQFAFVRIFHRPLSICRNFTLATSKQHSSATFVERNKYIRLRNHLANNIQWLLQERQKVEMLTGLRDRPVWKGVNFVLADIITVFTEKSQSEFIINRGKEDGLVKGQFVLGQHSIVGIISDLDSRTARVCLVTNPNSKTAVRIGELNLHGIMQGNGSGSARIELLPIKYKVKIGDIVYVQKKPGFLDSPMIVGMVVQCKTDDANPLLWDIKVDPACDIERLNSVSVIVMDSQEQHQSCNTEQPADSQVVKQEDNVFLAIDKENLR